MLKIRMLGQFTLRRDGEPVTLPSRPAQSLLAYVVLHAGMHQRREKLAGLFWPEFDEARARNNLRQALWRVRNAIGEEHLLTDGVSICFDVTSDYWLDVTVLEMRASETASVEDLIDQLSLYKGELLPGFYDDWVGSIRERVRIVFEHKVQHLLDLLANDQRWADVASWSERWLALGQAPESAYRTLMLAHAQEGDTRAVAATYWRCVATLPDELGIGPSKEIQELYTRLSRRHHNLPAQLTSFVGRESIVAQITGLLGKPECRLLTLVGPPGSGKTRLALQVTEAMIDEFNDGAFFVRLAPVSDPALVPDAVAKALGVRGQGSRPLTELLMYHMRDAHMLLLLDNFEHLIEAAPVVTEFLSASPNLTAIVTSREPLHVSGEHELFVPPLALPDLGRSKTAHDLAQYEAVALFIERAQTVNPRFQLDEDNAPIVAEICVRLDGLPLAIELAAPRVKSLLPRELLARLERRLDMLVDGMRDLSPRHRTLRATIEWSHNLLDSAEQTLFNRLGVFAGGCTLESAEDVCAPGLPSKVETELEALLNKSLLQQDRRPGGGLRIRMLETLREYALEQLEATDQLEELKRRHANHYLALAEQGEIELKGHNQTEWLDRLETEHDNLRAALEWLVEGDDPELALRLAGALGRFWWVRSHFTEGKRWLVRALERNPATPKPVRAKALHSAGVLAWYMQDFAQGATWHEEALSLFRDLGDKANEAWALTFLGGYSLPNGAIDEFESFSNEALKLFREIDDKDGIAWALMTLGIAARVRGDVERAMILHEESLTIYRELGSKYFIGATLNHMGYVAQQLGNYDHMQALFEESLSIAREEGLKIAIAHALIGLGSVAGLTGQPERAARLFGASDAILEALGAPTNLPEYEPNLLAVRAQLDVAAFEVARAEGRGMREDQAIAYALGWGSKL